MNSGVNPKSKNYYIQKLFNSARKKIPHSLNMQRVKTEMSNDEQSMLPIISIGNNTSRDKDKNITEPSFTSTFLRINYTERSRDQLLQSHSEYNLRELRIKSRNRMTHDGCEKSYSIVEDTSKIYLDKLKIIQSVQDFTERDSRYKMQVNPSSPIRERQKPSIILIGESQQADVDLIKNQFVYAQVEIYNRQSPLIFFIKIKEGEDKKSQFKIFASLSIPKPNPFNCEVEVLGCILKFNSDREVFTTKFLYISIYPKQDSSVTLQVEFFNQKRQRSYKSTFAAFLEKHKKNKDKDQITLVKEHQLQLDIEFILAKRKKKYENQMNFMERNKMVKDFDVRSRHQKIEFNRVSLQVKLLHSKLKKQHNLEKLKINQIAQQKMHEIANDLKTEFMEIKVILLRKQQFQGQWIKLISLTLFVIPSIQAMITNQRIKIQKKMKQQIDLVFWINRVMKRMKLFGPNSTTRTLSQTKILVISEANYLKKKTKKEARSLLFDFLSKTSVNYHSFKEGQRIINITRYCVQRLVRYKQNKNQFVELIKSELQIDMKFLQSEALHYLKDPEDKPQLQNVTNSVNKKKVNLTNLMNEIGFLNELTRIIFKYVFDKWNMNVIHYRDVMKSGQSNQKILALLLVPPKLFEMPSLNIVREIFLQLLNRKGLIVMGNNN